MASAAQQQDWNALPDEELRRIFRAWVDENCPRHLRFMRKHTNVWSKVSCPERLSVSGPPALNGEQNAYRDVVRFARKVVESFPDRVLWGTDWPHPNLKDHMPDDGLLVDFIPHIAATPELQRKLLVDNPTRLYWPEETN